MPPRRDRPVLVASVDILSDHAQDLVRALNAELSEIYPEEGMRHFRLDAEEVAPGRGAFMVAYLGALPVGCGAVRLLGQGIAEVKRMYTVPSARGRGVAALVLAALEAEAVRLGAGRLILETGVRQPAAQALYRRAGFDVIECWAEYAGQPMSICMAKDLAVADETYAPAF